MFSPITENMEQRLELIKGSMSKELATEELQKCESLEDFYWYSKKVKNGIIAQMQIYVLENFKKVPLEVWNKNNFTIHTHLGGEKLRFGKEDEFKGRWINSKTMQKLERENYDKSIKIESINFVLDEMDGDFSVDFNSGAWSFIWEDDIVDYYYTIKNYLNDK